MRKKIEGKKMKIKKLCQLILAVLPLVFLPSRLHAVGKEHLLGPIESSLDGQSYFSADVWGVIFSFIENADDFKNIRLTGRLFRSASYMASSNYVKNSKIGNKFIFTLYNKSVITLTKEHYRADFAERPDPLITDFSKLISDRSRPDGLLRCLSHFEFVEKKPFQQSELANKTGHIIWSILDSFQQNLVTTLVFYGVCFDSNSLSYLARVLPQLDQLTTLNFENACDFYDGVKPVALALNRLANLKHLEFNILKLTRKDLVDLSLVASQLTTLTEFSLRSDTFDDLDRPEAGSEKALAFIISGLTNLVALYIESDLIDSASLVHFGPALGQLTQLTRLKLLCWSGGDNLTEAASNAFAVGLSGLASLKKLEVDFIVLNSWVSSIGYCAALEDLCLSCLCLSYSDELAQLRLALSQLRKLKKVRAGPDYLLSDVEKQQLIKDFPEVEIDII